MAALPVFRHTIQQGTLVLSVALLSVGCGGSGSGTSETEDDNDQLSATATETSLATQAMESIYYNRRTPENFYNEPEPDPGLFQTVSHIKNIDVMAPGSYTDATPRYELCANDFSEALNWSIASGSGLGSLVDNTDTELFFQFTRSPIGSPQISNLQRVYKCSRIDRSALDIRALDRNWGLYTETPPVSVNIKELIEYLWTFSTANSYGNAVLNSSIAEQSDRFVHSMQQARLVTAASLDADCDRIDIYLTKYQIDKATGSIEVDENWQQSVYATFDGYEIRQCEG